jgi:hypothetical protein
MHFGAGLPLEPIHIRLFEVLFKPNVAIKQNAFELHLAELLLGRPDATQIFLKNDRLSALERDP